MGTDPSFFPKEVRSLSLEKTAQPLSAFGHTRINARDLSEPPGTGRSRTPHRHDGICMRHFSNQNSLFSQSFDYGNNVSFLQRPHPCEISLKRGAIASICLDISAVFLLVLKMKPTKMVVIKSLFKIFTQTSLADGAGVINGRSSLKVSTGSARTPRVDCADNSLRFLRGKPADLPRS